MSLTIDLSPEQEHALEEMASQQGVSVEELVKSLFYALGEKPATSEGVHFTPEGVYFVREESKSSPARRCESVLPTSFRYQTPISFKNRLIPQIIGESLGVPMVTHYAAALTGLHSIPIAQIQQTDLVGDVNDEWDEMHNLAERMNQALDRIHEATQEVVSDLRSARQSLTEDISVNEHS